MTSRFLTAFGLVLLATLSIARFDRPPAPVAATAPDTVFSAERAARHVAQIAQRPHPMGTAEHDRVRNYVVGQLVAMGVRPDVQTTTSVASLYPEAGHVQNIIGYLPGTEPNGTSVLLVAHYDGVEAGPAAADDGAGTAALLETIRALRARPLKLKQDIIALFTDGEEAGLLGAAAYVREHPSARTVAFTLNFEARGTSGRSFMFETGPGNLDAARVLRSAGDVTAGSVFTTVYRQLPNDTDLSEFAALGMPAMNFAFTQGVERYHTSHDDVAHLDHGSLQHHGAQMLSLAKTLGSEPLPRPKTGDGVFFDLPVIGLVVYPLSLAIPLAVLVAALMGFALWPLRRSVLPSAGLLLATLVLTGGAASLVRLSGPAMWSGWYGLAIALVAIAVNAAVVLYADARWRRAEAGALLVWGVLAIALSLRVPSVSYLFVWPALFALVAARSESLIAEWISAAFALVMLVSLADGAAVVMLGLSGPGVIALVVLVSLLTWLCAPLLRRVFASWRAALVTCGGLAAATLAIALVVVRPNADHPARSAIVYAENAGTGEAFLGGASSAEPWTRGVLGTVGPAPSWMSFIAGRARVLGHPAAREGLESPSITLLSDSTSGAERTLGFRVSSPRGSTATVVRVPATTVLRATIDGIAVNAKRYRRRVRDWTIEFWSVPDQGTQFVITVPAGSPVTVEVAARHPGLPANVRLAPRPEAVVPSDIGDVSVSYRAVKF